MRFPLEGTAFQAFYKETAFLSFYQLSSPLLFNSIHYKCKTLKHLSFFSLRIKVKMSAQSIMAT